MKKSAHKNSFAINNAFSKPATFSDDLVGNAWSFLINVASAWRSN